MNVDIDTDRHRVTIYAVRDGWDGGWDGGQQEFRVSLDCFPTTSDVQWSAGAKVMLRELAADFCSAYNNSIENQKSEKND